MWTEYQRQEIADRAALRFAEIVKRNGHHPRGADIEAALARAKSLEERAGA